MLFLKSFFSVSRLDYEENFQYFFEILQEHEAC